LHIPDGKGAVEDFELVDDPIEINRAGAGIE